MDEESEAFTRAKNSMSKKKIDKGKELKSESEEEDEEEEKEDIEQVTTNYSIFSLKIIMKVICRWIHLFGMLE